MPSELAGAVFHAYVKRSELRGLNFNEFFEFYYLAKHHPPEVALLLFQVYAPLRQGEQEVLSLQSLHQLSTQLFYQKLKLDTNAAYLT